MKNTELIIGIDVGWSEKRPSCGVAIKDPLDQIQWPNSTVTYGGTSSTKCCKFRLSELLDFLGRIPSLRYTKIVVVIDGPLGPEGPPQKNREVDSAFRCNEFNGRMQPMDIEGKDGGTYVEATYRVANFFADSVKPWPFSQAESKLLIAETHPTVGLALFNRKHNVRELPSRKRPLVPPSGQANEGAIRAKSDFYWRIGGNRQCESMLDCTGIAEERDHERVAALYCLAVAVSLANGQATAVGKKDSGVYVFPKVFHQDWIEDIKSIGVIGNDPLELMDVANTDCFTKWQPAHVATTVPANGSTNLEEENDNASDPEQRGDVGWLLLNDNGGVHEKHNLWLTNFTNCVQVRLIKRNLEATLIKANSPTQWKIDSNSDKALGIAKQYGFVFDHLSNANAFSIEFEVVKDCGQNIDV
ncbi:MAG: hypothetical protein WCI02_07285 [Planctomycetota bacterium]